MKEHIGEIAGKVWITLGKHEQIPLNKLSKVCKCGDDTTTNIALGWLAREDKVQFEKKNEAVMVSLTDREADVFKSNTGCNQAAS